MAEAEGRVFGLCLLNDWSARDLQAWEYQPLGPFLAKNFATTISPWILTLEALAPFRVPFERPADDPQPLPYLDSAANRARGAIDVQLEVALETPRMREQNAGAARLTRTSYRHAYWTIAQMVAIPMLLFHDPLFGLIDVHAIGTVLIYVAAVLTVYSMLIYLRLAWPHLNDGA